MVAHPTPLINVEQGQKIILGKVLLDLIATHHLNPLRRLTVVRFGAKISQKKFNLIC